MYLKNHSSLEKIPENYCRNLDCCGIFKIFFQCAQALILVEKMNFNIKKHLQTFNIYFVCIF